jgi:peptidyl-prolyl cis-trans isomerase D
MTMLDRMRRHKGWLKWSLGVVVATFIFLYVPQFLDPTGTGAGTGAAPGDVLATVEGRRVTAGVYQRIYLQQIAQLRASYGQISDQMLAQLQIGPQLMRQLVNQEAVIIEAERRGITVSDGELRERLMRLPSFQENGQFVGEARYRLMLESARPPVRPAEFEADLRRSILSEKLQTAVTGWITVTPADVEEEYRRRNEKVRFDLAVFNADAFRAGITPTDAELTAEYQAHPDAYRVPEKRRVRYLSIDATAMAERMTATPQEVQARYQQNQQAFSTPEQIRASHILLKTEGKDEAAVRKTAEGLLAKAKAGADFAALAKQYSEDEQSKIAGGDLDFFGRGSMVPEFDQAAWALEPGQVSDLVKSPYGFHIIKLAEKRPATTRSIDEVRPQLEMQIKSEKARAEAARLATEIDQQIDSPDDFDRVAKERSLTVGDSGLFSRDEPLAGLSFEPAVSAEAFSLDQGETSGQIATSRGFAFITVTEIKPAAVPPLDEVRDKVRDNVVRAKAVELASQKAAEMARSATARTFESSAKAAGATVRTTELVTRGSAIPDVGVSDKIDAAAFSLKAGDVSQPIATDSAVVVLHVRERQDITPEGLAAERDNLRAQLEQERRGNFFSAYMAKAMEDMSIEYNETTVQRVLAQ